MVMERAERISPDGAIRTDETREIAFRGKGAAREILKNNNGMEPVP